MKEFSSSGAQKKEAIDINKAIANTITVSRNEWKKVAEMVTMFDQDMPPVACFPMDFNLMILNIIMNAVHAVRDVMDTKNEGKGIISISTSHTSDWAEIRVSDTGAGIPEEARPRIFDPFFTTREVGKGRGMGLTTAYSIVVEKHNGTISFDTETGKGTTFIIRLPLGLNGAK